MKKNRFLFLSVLFSLIIASSCEKDDQGVINESKVLVEYLETTITPATLPAYIVASDLHAANVIGTAYIIDVRAEDAYNAGHIQNAVNVSLANILSYVQTTDLSAYEKIVVVCYSGQSAAWGTSLLRLSGVSNAYSLKWGMTGWTPDFDSWTSKTSNMYYTQFETTTNTKNADTDKYPVLSTGFETGADILNTRLVDIYTEGFGVAGITAADAYADLDNYYIINYWPEAHYSDPGHIERAIDYIPGQSLTTDTDLTTLPTDKTILVYCYSGQTSAYITAYLRLLGYDAKTLKFGANSMIYDHMPAGKWQTLTQGYDYVTTN